MLRELRLGLVSRLSRGGRGDEAANQDAFRPSQDGAPVDVAEDGLVDLAPGEAGDDLGPVDLAPPPPVPALTGAQVRPMGLLARIIHQRWSEGLAGVV